VARLWPPASFLQELSAPGNKNDMIVKGRNFTVTYTALNVGELEAADVRIKDVWPPETFELLEGAAEVVLPSLAP